jgi:hypothetical protein
MQKLRSVHLYLGCLFAPMLLFFAISGIWQTYILGKTAKEDKKTKHPRLDKDIATANEIITQVQSVSLSANADNCDPAVWADESFAMAQDDVYSPLDLQPFPTDRGDQLQATLDASYAQTATRDAKLRIRAAGHRLAVMLKQVLGQ